MYRQKYICSVCLSITEVNRFKSDSSGRGGAQPGVSRNQFHQTKADLLLF